MRACCALVLSLIVPAAARAEPVNVIVGDVSFVERFHRPPEPRDDHDPSSRVRVHLAWVVRELRAHPEVEAPSVRRAKLLDALERYTAAAEFPINRLHSRRRPRFMDEEGRLCAVGYLIAITDGLGLAREIAARFEHEHLLDIDDPRLDAWIAGSGFTARELAMIQPMYGPPDGREAFATGRYEEAYRLFEQRYALSARPRLLYNMGVAAERAGWLDRAVASYRRFLRAEPTTELRPEVEATLARLERELAPPPPLRPPMPAANRGCACNATGAARGASILSWLVVIVLLRHARRPTS